MVPIVCALELPVWVPGNVGYQITYSISVLLVAFVLVRSFVKAMKKGNETFR